jgi:hypothetical protein
MSKIVEVGIAIGLFLIPSAALAGNYQTCIQVEVDTVDSGHDILYGPDAGLSEDHWTSCDSGCNVIARGVRFKVAKGSWSATYDSDPSTGCFNWSHADTSGFTITVYGYATNSESTFVRIHDGDYDTTSTYPGATYSTVLTNVTPTNGGSNTYYIGDYVPRWTTFASAAFGIYRYPYENTDKEIHVAFDHRGGLDCGDGDPNDICCTSSSVYGAGAVTSGRHYFFIGDNDGVDCASTASTRKFVVTHELGHSLLRLHSNVNGAEPYVNGTHLESAPDACGVGPAGSYTMRSNEWNSVGFKEGFAHFIAARIWNERSQSGAFTWNSAGVEATHDLERYGLGAGNSSGGRLENECCTSGCSASWPSAGTNEDWLRFYWDFYNNNYDPNCPYVPDSIDMLNLYDAVRTNGNLDCDAYFQALEAEVGGIGLETCLSGTAFDFYADLNGINHPLPAISGC